MGSDALGIHAMGGVCGGGRVSVGGEEKDGRRVRG